MKTKIMFVLPTLNGGGAERVAVNILRQLDLKKFKVTLVLVEKTGILLELIPSNIEIIDLGAKKTMFSILKLRKIISRVKPDIIFSTLIRTHIAVELALTGIKKRPKIIYRSPNSPKLLLENNQLSVLMRKLLERAYRNADLILAQTPEMKDEIEKFHGIEANKITVFLNPIDSKLIDEKIQNIQNPFDRNYINVVAAGRLIHQKGFDILIQSFQKVIERNNKFRLYIIGEDVVGEKKKLISLAKSIGLEKYIIFLGFQTNPYKYFYYSDLYVLSSRWEGLPNTVLENLYLKKPIVATKCISFMDTLIADGQNGILVDVGDQEALAQAILNYEKIDTEYKSINFDTSNIEDIFKKTIEKPRSLNV